MNFCSEEKGMFAFTNNTTKFLRPIKILVSNKSTKMAFFYAFWTAVLKNQKKMDYRKFFHIICYGSMHQIFYVILVQSVIVQSCSASCRECNVLKWHSYISIYRIFWVMKCFPFLLMFHDFSTPTITCVVGSEKNY